MALDDRITNQFHHNSQEMSHSIVKKVPRKYHSPKITVLNTCEINSGSTNVPEDSTGLLES
jgi:hypothetical protein